MKDDFNPTSRKSPPVEAGMDSAPGRERIIGGNSNESKLGEVKPSRVFLKGAPPVKAEAPQLMWAYVGANFSLRLQKRYLMHAI